MTSSRDFVHLRQGVHVTLSLGTLGMTFDTVFKIFFSRKMISGISGGSFSKEIHYQLFSCPQWYLILCTTLPRKWSKWICLNQFEFLNEEPSADSGGTSVNEFFRKLNHVGEGWFAILFSVLFADLALERPLWGDVLLAIVEFDFSRKNHFPCYHFIFLGNIIYVIHGIGTLFNFAPTFSTV